MKNMQSLNRVDVLVHPFYSLLQSDASAYRLRRKNIDFLFGLWGKRIGEIAKDQWAAIVWIHSDALVDPNQWLPGWRRVFVPRYEKLVRFASSRLGKRLVRVNDHVNAFALRKQLASHGLRFSPETKGESFGEWWNQCVYTETPQVENALGLPAKKIRDRPGYSIAHFPGTGGLGSFTQDLRVQAVRFFRTSQKQKAVLPKTGILFSSRRRAR